LYWIDRLLLPITIQLLRCRPIEHRRAAPRPPPIWALTDEKTDALLSASARQAVSHKGWCLWRKTATQLSLICLGRQDRLKMYWRPLIIRTRETLSSQMPASSLKDSGQFGHPGEDQRLVGGCWQRSIHGLAT
jgi:hypothetical protein